ncbi:MAG: winged helix-turn-helix transcriptional regulator [Candidatus Thorarchaeota archaeon]|nr:winged helix-turn-helix transcriptional regulator [Candidatus Thorarchaeota archaeon]
MTNEEPTDEQLADLIKGKTLSVYWYMLRHPQPMTAREIQRGAELSSPSLSMHHLERLRQYGLVEKDVHGQYSITRDVRIGILNQFMGRGRLMVPRFLFYATFYTSLTAALATLAFWFIDWYSAVLIILLISICVVLWYEALKVWREQPFTEGERD